MVLASYALVLRLKVLAGNPELGCLCIVLPPPMSAVVPVNERLAPADSKIVERRRLSAGGTMKPLSLAFRNMGISVRFGTCSIVNGTIVRKNTATEIVFGIDALQRTIGPPDRIAAAILQRQKQANQAWFSRS